MKIQGNAINGTLSPALNDLHVAAVQQRDEWLAEVAASGSDTGITPELLDPLAKFIAGLEFAMEQLELLVNALAQRNEHHAAPEPAEFV